MPGREDLSRRSRKSPNLHPCTLTRDVHHVRWFGTTVLWVSRTRGFFLPRPRKSAPSKSRTRVAGVPCGRSSHYSQESVSNSKFNYKRLIYKLGYIYRFTPFWIIQNLSKILGWAQNQRCSSCWEVQLWCFEFSKFQCKILNKFEKIQTPNLILKPNSKTRHNWEMAQLSKL